MSEQRYFFNYLQRGARTAMSATGTADLDLVLKFEESERIVPVRGLGLAGPQHARGITQSAIRKRFPPSGSTDMRAGALPYVEFHDPALPWGLTPSLPNGGRLSPFIALLCVPYGTEDTPSWLHTGTLPLPTAQVHLLGGLPDPAGHELMAHIEDPDPTVDGRPGRRAFARLLCPQRLVPRTRYIALVVPLYEAGRLTGLGEQLAAAGAPGFSWQAGATSAILPVYASWRFTTGISRGPENMLRELHAVPPTGGITKVPVDDDVAADLVPPLVGTQIHKRAIFPANDPAPQHPDLALAPALDFADAAAAGRLPMPAYARAFAYGLDPGSVGAPAWYDGVNLDPSFRVMAGHGADIVRRKQDDIVTFVLDSAGQLEEANALLSRAHTAMALTRPLHRAVTAAQVPDSALARLIGPAAARSSHRGGSMAGAALGSADEVLQDPRLHRAMAAGGSLDRDRHPRDDPAEAVRAGAARASSAPVVPGAAPLGDAVRVVDDQTVGQSGVIHAQQGTVEEWLDLAVSGKEPLRENIHLAQADRLRRQRQDGDRRRPAEVERPYARKTPARSSLIAALDPIMTVRARVSTRISGLPPGPLPQRIPAEPVWPHPVVSELFAADPDTLSPGLAGLTDDGVMALSFDAAAVDAVILGANAEVLRELRWRGIPHDPLVSPVRRAFPRPSATGELDPDTRPLRNWEPNRRLGEGRVSGINLIVLIRSQLFNKYPETVITLVEAVWDAERGCRELDPGQTHLPKVMGRVGDDVTYVGFTQDRLAMAGSPDPHARRPGGFLVFQQPTGGLTFGLSDDVDEAAASRTLSSWNELAWSDLTAPEIRADTLNARVSGPLSWGQGSATMAAILLERPVTVALHVSDIVGEVPR